MYPENYNLGEWNDIHPIDRKTLAKRINEKMDEDCKKSKKNLKDKVGV